MKMKAVGKQLKFLRFGAIYKFYIYIYIYIFIYIYIYM